MSNYQPSKYQLSGEQLILQLSKFGIEIESARLSQIKQQSFARIVNDSRQIQAGDVFCAVIGHEQDGNAYIETAVKQGASLVLAQCQQATEHGLVQLLEVAERQVLKISFYQLAQQSFALASAYYQSPQSKQTLIGITGTNGKTSTSQICAHLLGQVQVQAINNAAVIGTNGAGLLGHLTELNNTTPGSFELMDLLAGFAEHNVSHVAMEVSSHAMTQQRVAADMFNVAVFTNLTRDHLDYHQTMENYAQAKFSLFSASNDQQAIFNVADKYGKEFYQQLLAKRAGNSSQMFAYSLGNSAKQFDQFICAENIQHQANGVTFVLSSHLGEQQITSPLLGDFNIENLLAAIAVLFTQNVGLKEIAAAIATLSPVAGRMECFSKQGFATAIVDYAHTPDALENALIAARQHCHGQLWAVFGCGGNRDKGKRSLMGKVAENKADQIVLTNDNPRNEKPQTIVDDILFGCVSPEKITVCLDRKTAVLDTLNQAQANDVVLFAGKGHEDYIVLGDEKINYDERALVASFFSANSLSENQVEQKL